MCVLTSTLNPGWSLPSQKRKFVPPVDGHNTISIKYYWYRSAVIWGKVEGLIPLHIRGILDSLISCVTRRLIITSSLHPDRMQWCMHSLHHGVMAGLGLLLVSEGPDPWFFRIFDTSAVTPGRSASWSELARLQSIDSNTENRLPDRPIEQRGLTRPAINAKIFQCQCILMINGHR